MADAVAREAEQRIGQGSDLVRGMQVSLALRSGLRGNRLHNDQRTSRGELARTYDDKSATAASERRIVDAEGIIDRQTVRISVTRIAAGRCCARLAPTHGSRARDRLVNHLQRGASQATRARKHVSR